jgi:hypothetical protein
MKRILILATFAIAAGSAAPSYAGRDGADLMQQEKARKAVVAQRQQQEVVRRSCAATPECGVNVASAASGTGQAQSPSDKK